MDILNALVAFLNFVFIPGLAYGSQLALGALALSIGARRLDDCRDEGEHTRQHV